jgi:hypothetical protein
MQSLAMTDHTASGFLSRPWCNGNYTGAKWVQETEPIVPLMYSDNTTMEYLNNTGYTFCVGDTLKSYFKPAAILKFKYSSMAEECPYRFFTRDMVRECLVNKWVHIDGDSLMRDQYYDLLEAMGEQPPCKRIKSHADQHVFVPGINFTLTIGFNPAFRPGAYCIPKLVYL